jgi:hypothetical protein
MIFPNSNYKISLLTNTNDKLYFNYNYNNGLLSIKYQGHIQFDQR